MSRLALVLTCLLGLACPARDEPLDLRPEPLDLRPEPVALDVHAWFAELDTPPPTVSLATRFPSPTGYARVTAAPGSFAAFLRSLPVRLDRATVHDFRGREIWRPAAVIALDVGDKDLQQCADTLIRLHAEWLWSRGRFDELAYHFTSGDHSRFVRHVAGRRLAVEGSKVVEVEAAPVPRDRAALRGWLEQVFMYAGTRSLALDSELVPLADEIAPGDMLLRPGSPGHVVMILDVARAPDGDALALVGEGSMPAQELHVLPGPIDDAWFRFPVGEDVAVDVPGWGTLSRSSLRRFRAR